MTFLCIYNTSQTDLFADDTTIIASSDHKHISDLEKKLSKEVSNVDEWANTNTLPLNADKTKILLVQSKRLHTIT